MNDLIIEGFKSKNLNAPLRGTGALEQRVQARRSPVYRS